MIEFWLQGKEENTKLKVKESNQRKVIYNIYNNNIYNKYTKKNKKYFKNT